MSRFFRSHSPTVGDRVVVRRLLPDTPGHLTDVVGHVLTLDPLTVRPQRVGGLPSRAAAVVIPPELVKVVRILSPRRVRNSEIRAVESALAHARPAATEEWTRNGQWLLRAEQRPTATVAIPLGPTAGLEAIPKEEILSFFARHPGPARLRLVERIARNAESLLAASPAGWRLGPELAVLCPAAEEGAIATGAGGAPPPIEESTTRRNDAPAVGPPVEVAAAELARTPESESGPAASLLDAGYVEHHRARYATFLG